MKCSNIAVIKSYLTKVPKMTTTLPYKSNAGNPHGLEYPNAFCPFLRYGQSGFY